MDTKVFIKLMLINVLVFVILCIAFWECDDTSSVLEAGTGFYSMEVGVLIGVKVAKNEKGDKK